jgi:AraC family transcriptional regulator
LAKIAVMLEEAVARRAAEGAPGSTRARLVAKGEGWLVQDVVCTCGARDRPYQEWHSDVRIALVSAGTFQYRADAGLVSRWELMTPGSVLLGNPGQSFECGHQHAAGDRCLSFGYAPAYFEGIAGDAGARGARRILDAPRLPPLRALAPLVARAFSGLRGAGPGFWEELAVALAARAVPLARGEQPGAGSAPAGAVARVTRIARVMEREPGAEWTLARMALEARLSPYHFLRTFEGLTGLTPHQYLLRARLRLAAIRLVEEPAKVIDVALDCGFGDVSNFNRAFRAEFGMSPRLYRRETGPGRP